MKVYIRILFSVITMLVGIGIVDYFIEGGFFKYLLIGIIVASILLYNDKKNKGLKNVQA
ncbi:hypothetical protein MPH47_21460 [Psychrobacillus psychrodurans]|uniref:hypothetical protein n=1 Tax=Psychrobacillus TaxID=1221880 RepID=UPI0008F1B45C|nr:hypothetical protein [Psychrobacillus psychrodurans]MCK1999751.1 hypothetical protein [Psychrobacillus psychrodurans]MCZ8542228.1 hypothetical protein [Psychrobacillus psychrodurans]SFN28396.1 hypothetical protein SAMN05421832_1338 [Psychrobacillus psychrodurans]